MNQYYEEIEIYLVSDSVRKREDLHIFLKNKGYKSEDDFYYISRDDKVEPWQSFQLLTLDIKLGDEDKYETEEDIEEGISTEWDKILASYLLATIPEDGIEKFIKKVQEIKSELNLKLFYCEEEITMDKLSKTLNLYAKKIEEKYYVEVGSEWLCRLIEDN